MPILAEPSSISFKQKVIYSTAATSRGCLLVYPPGKKSRQRFAVGDSTGVFRVFSIGKRLDAVLAFETDDAKSGTAILPCVGKKAISAATLFSDQLFYAQGSVLRAYSRKGKNFFSTETNVTEQLTAIWIETPFIFLAGEFMVTTMVESKEIGFFLSPDRVHDMCVYSITKSGNSDAAPQLDDYMCCLACNDRSLRLVQSNKMVEAMSCEASLTALRLDTSARRVFYGTQVGSIGVMKIQNNGMLRRCGGHLPFEDATSAPGSAGVAQRRGGDGATVCVTCLGLADVNGDGVDELLVGYEDGTVRVFSIVAEQSSPTARPSAKLESGAVVLTVIWTGSVGERVMSIAGGVITQSPDQPDILIHTYSGQVIAFTLDADGPVRNAAAAAEIAAFHKAALEAKQQDTEREIAELRALIEQRTSELSEATGAVKTPAPVVAVASTFKATATLTPIENMPLLSLVVYADVPLEGVLVQCAPELTFMSTDMATVSRQLDNCGSRGAASRRLLAVSPSQKGAKRLEVHLWADEGRTDTLRLTVISAIAPRTAQMKWVPLYSLPLFARVSADTPDILPEDAPRIISKLIISGSFAGQDVHEWLGQLLPGMAEAPYQEGVNRFAFVSKFLSSVLVVDAEDDQQGGVGRVVFSSNSLLTLASIKRHVTSMTAQRGVSIVVREHILFNSAVHQLRQLQPMMEAMASSARRLQLVKGLQELQGSETHLDFLPVHLQEILASAEEIQVEVDLQAQQQAYIRRTIAGLYSSLVYFKNHTTPLTVATRKQLEAVSCGIEYNPKTLEMLLFPRGEHHHELGVVEQLPQGSAVPQANTETARMLTEASPTSATAPATTSMRRLEAVSAESSRSATPEPVTK